ncbi:MAG: DUF2652 domain-containing protein [Bacteroidota bacterium]
MAENNATILIPDISGFTEFMTTTELSHSSHAINLLIDAMLEAVGEEYEVSEIEGDAVLLIKKGPAPSQKEIMNTCLKIFNGFHFQRKFLELNAVCPCGACQAIIDLTLKFVVHHGPLAEIKVGRFVKQSGTEMIVAHRLLKNSINNDEYLLLTEKLFNDEADPSGVVDMEWIRSADEYASIGKVDYRFTLLNEARKNVPDPPAPQYNYPAADMSYMEMTIAANYIDVYMMLMDIPSRPQWVPGLQKVEQDRPEVFVGSIHRCTFSTYSAVVTPLKMTILEDGILFAESCRIEERDLSLVYEFVFKKMDENSCSFMARLINAGETPVHEKVQHALFEEMQEMGESLKKHCEKKEVS